MQHKLLLTCMLPFLMTIKVTFEIAWVAARTDPTPSPHHLRPCRAKVAEIAARLRSHMCASHRDLPRVQ